MQQVFFGMKRVMYNLRRKFWDELRKCWIPATPAQYEVLRILQAYEECGVPRFKLVRLLGVSGPVVSRMLRALESVGLIERKRAERDRRSIIVTLTSFGFGAIYGWNPKEPKDFQQWMDARIRETFTSSQERADIELDLLGRYLWRARYNAEDTSPRLNPFTCGDVLSLRGWITLPPPPPLVFAA